MGEKQSKRGAALVRQAGVLKGQVAVTRRPGARRPGPRRAGAGMLHPAHAQGRFPIVIREIEALVNGSHLTSFLRLVFPPPM